MEDHGSPGRESGAPSRVAHTERCRLLGVRGYNLLNPKDVGFVRPVRDCADDAEGAVMLHSHTLRSRMVLVLFVVMIAAVVMTLVQAEAAAAWPGTAVINGRVTAADTSGGLSLGIAVTLYENDGSDWIYRASATTNIDGYFQFTGVGSGTFRAWVQTPPAGYQQGWKIFNCDGLTQSEGASVVLVPNLANDGYENDDNRWQARLTTPDINELHSLYTAGDGDWIRLDATAGHTYVIETAYPWIAGAAVQPYTQTDTVLELLRPMGGYLETFAEVDDGGSGLFSQINYVAEESGVRYARVSGYGDATGWYRLIVREVTPEIAGKVTSTANGLPVKGIEVRAWDWDEGDATYYLAGTAFTDANGRYALPDMGSSEYFLEFRDPSTDDGLYLDEYYHNRADLDDADPVITAMGVTTTVNEALDPSPPSISGTVTEEGTGDPIFDLPVTAYTWSGGWYEAGWTWTDQNGDYEIYGLRDAEAIVLFGNPGYDGRVHEAEWYDDSATQGGAYVIDTAIGGEQSGIVAELTRRTPSITGTLTDEITGEPIWGIRAQLYVWNGGGWDAGPEFSTGEDGVYGFYELMPGTYTLDFYDPSAWAGYYDYEVWDDHTSWLDADPFVFTGGTYVADAALTPGDPDISGRVTDEVTGDPIPGISVASYYDALPGPGEDWEAYQYDMTDEDGQYAIYGLPQGMQARIGFEDIGAQDGSYRTEFWDDAATVEAADGIFIEAIFGWPYTDIDVELTPGDPSIVGTVTDAISGDPIEGATAYLWQFLGVDDPIGAWGIDAMSTYADGTYAFCDLDPGIYWVEMEKPGYEYATSSWIDYTGALATQDFALTPVDADIGGVVRDAVTGHTIADANVDLYRFGGGFFYNVDGVAAGSTGGYRFNDVRHGGYKIVGWAFGYEDWEAYVEFDGDPVIVNPTLIPLPAGAPVRVADRSRFSTAVDIAKMAFDDDGDPSNGTQWVDVSHVIIASGDDRAAADPLAASGLCGFYDAPLFLVSAKDVPAEVEAAVNEIVDQNGAVTVHIVGGTMSVPDARYTELVNAVGGGLSKDRILATGGRYDLAAAIARRMYPGPAAPPDVVLVANGADPNKFFDALALSPLAAAQQYPILLVSKDTIPSATQSVIDEFDPETVVMGGGPNTISNTVKTSLGALRWYGSSRYTTAITIANNAISRGWLSDSAVGVAAKLPDALTGGGVIGRMGGVLLLTKGDTLTPETGAWIQTHNDNITNCYVFGGPNSVTTAVVNAIKAKLQ